MGKKITNRRSYRGAGNPKAKLTAEQVNIIRLRRACFEPREKATDPKATYAYMAEEFGVSQSTIHKVCHWVSW